MSDTAFFREITPVDLPRLKEMTQKIWEGEDYLPHVIDRWLQDPNAAHIGLFRKPEMQPTDLIGFSRVHWYPNGVYWIEGGRIDPTLQKQGYGRLLAQYCIQFSIDHGAKRVQYDTWGSRDRLGDPTVKQNHGSITLAHQNGFQKKAYVDSMVCKVSELQIPKVQPPIKPLFLTPFILLEVIPALTAALGYTPEEINRGWSYVPCLSSAIVDQEQGMRIEWWGISEDINHPIVTSQAVAQMLFPSHDAIVEGPQNQEVWIILYGRQEFPQRLLIRLLENTLNLETLESIQIFCDPILTSSLLPFGFTFFEGDPSGVVLFEKQIHEIDKSMKKTNPITMI